MAQQTKLAYQKLLGASMATELYRPIINGFNEIKAALEHLRTCMLELDCHLPAWFQAPVELPLSAHLSEREKAFALIAQLEYLDCQNPREILVGAGLIAASQDTLEALERLNCAKDQFKAAMLSLKLHKISKTDDVFNGAVEQLLGRTEKTEAALKRFGLSRLHLKQCYRRIPYFERRPLKVSWTWANTRAITKIDVETAFEMLNKQGRDRGIELQLKRLSELSPSEDLAIVQDLAPHLRANIILPIPEQKAIQRLMVKGPIPLFYLDKDHLPLPVFKAPGEKKARDKNRGVRNDVKLEPEPFLSAIRVHRYASLEPAI